MTMRQWIGATTLGWILGVPLVALAAILGEALFVGGKQFLVGLGMGVGIGLLQGVALRRWRSWIVATVIGLTAPFLAIDVAHALHRDFPFGIALVVACCGVTVGLAQALVMRASRASRVTWIASSVLGWGAAALTVMGWDAMFRHHLVRGLGGAIAYLALMCAGGPLLGLVTGAALRVHDTRGVA